MKVEKKKKKEDKKVLEDQTQVEMFQADLLNSLLGHVLSDEGQIPEPSSVEEVTSEGEK